MRAYCASMHAFDRMTIMAHSPTKPSLAERFQEADRLFQGQRYAEASVIYESLLHHRKAPTEVWHRLSLIALFAGDLKLACSYALEAQKRDPRDAKYILNLAELYRRLGQLEDALHWARTAVNQFPAEATAHYNLGSVYLDLQEDLRAQEAFIEVTRLQPNHALAWNNLGSVYQRCGQLDQAYGAYVVAVQIDPCHAEAQCNKGAILYQRQEYDLARSCTELALQSRPNFLEAKANLRQIVDPDGGPAYLEALATLAIKFQSQQRHLAVIELLQTEVRQDNPVTELAQLWHLLGISYYRLNQFASAYQCYQVTIALAPRFAGALNSLGFLLQDLRLYEDAKMAFEDALRLDPGSEMARLNLGLIQLKLGQWDEGWQNYECRWTGSAEAIHQVQQKPSIPLPPWDGITNPEHKTILVVAEQGFGDTIQFCRYLNLLRKEFPSVSFYVPDGLRRLMEWSFPQISISSTLPTRFDAWSCYTPLLSLPHRFQTRLDTIPSVTPYLEAPAIFKEYWARRLQQTRNGRLKIGIAWSGRKTLQYDTRRSIPFKVLMPLFAMEQVDWICLQKWDQNYELGWVQPQGWFDWTAELHDFADTAALIENLDAVIAVDSAVAHLAGALNRPVYLLNRYDGEWRWLCNQERSPWYPSMHILNQPEFGEWTPVIEGVKKHISGLALARSMGN